MSVDLFLLGPSPPELLSLRFLDALDIGLIPKVFVLGMGVGSCIREVALATETCEVPAFRILPLSPLFGLHLMFTRNDAI